MGSHGIRDRVAIVGMGCTNFAEHWDKGLDDLIIDASTEAFTSAGVTIRPVSTSRRRAAWSTIGGSVACASAALAPMARITISAQVDPHGPRITASPGARQSEKWQP